MNHQHHGHIHALIDATPLEWGGFVIILSYSFFASLHCAFMCGPLVCSVLGPKNHFKHLDLWIYNLSRVGAYILLGSGLGSLGLYFGSQSPMVGFILSWGLGICLLLIALSIGIANFKLPIPNSMRQLFVKPSQKVFKQIQRVPASMQPFALGAFTAFLPCMTLAPALAMATGSGSGLVGAVFMAGFGLGTLPVMFFSPMLTRQVMYRLPQNAGKVLAAVFLVIGGLITIMRAYPH